MAKLVKRSGRRSGVANARSRAFSCVRNLIDWYGRMTPRRKAILAPGRTAMTYGSLRDQVNATVRELRNFGIGRRDRVAVVLSDGPEATVAIIAVATGAICVPLNPGFTAHEWQRYFIDLRVSALLTSEEVDSASRDAAHALGLTVIDLSRSSRTVAGAFSLISSAARPPARREPTRSSDDAFILVTSGTTSRPKIVPLTHASVCLSARNVGSAIALTPRDRLLSVLPLFHGHGLISGVLAALAAGSSVVCTPGFDPTAFFRWLKEFEPTWYTAVPAIHLAVLSAAAQHQDGVRHSRLRLIRSASSSLSPDARARLEILFGVPVIDTYGMTEAATQIAANPLGRSKPGSVGRPAGPDIAIMDRNGRRLAADERGEIALRGPTIARGYDNDPAATRSAFRNGWFRTGDLGYLDADGYLFLVGRIKDTINRGGQEVAPAEVEAALLCHPDVIEAAAFPVPHARLGADVAAAVVLRPGADIDTSVLRSFARGRLASFKVPRLFRIVAHIPKSAAGKLQRNGLAAAFAIGLTEATESEKHSPPLSQLERQLAKIWADLLELDHVGIDQDVFALGADSLTVMQLLSRLRTRFGTNLSYKDIFEAPTVAALATRLKSLQPASAVMAPRRRACRAGGPDAPLSFQQQRMYFLSRIDETGHNYHVFQVARLLGPLDFGALAESVATICERQQALRSIFVERSGEPVQTVVPTRPRLERVELRSYPPSRRASAVRREARESVRRRFDLERGPLIRARLLAFDKGDHALVITLHHLVTDGWSQRLFWEELEALYSARVKGGAVELPELPIQYPDFIFGQQAWLRTRAAQDQLKYWRAQLCGLAELALRTDRPRPERWTGRGARHPFKLPRALSQGLKSLGQALGVSLFMTLLAAFQCLLYRYTGQPDVAVGSLIANRNQIERERLIGMFANTIVLRTDLSGDPPFNELLRRVREVTLSAYGNQDLPIEKILQDLNVPRRADRNPLFQVMFILQGARPTPPSLPGLSAYFVDVDPGIARFDLTLELADADGHLGGWIEYSTDLFQAATIGRMASHLRTLLEGIVANPVEHISRLPLLPAGERKLLLYDWNDTQTSFPRVSLAERFARQAERTPDAVAVSGGSVRLSYRELAGRSSAIADRLVREGVGPDVVVVLLAERSVDTLAAMIAVQRAGGVFLPLDPTIPAARLAQIVAHSRSRFVLAERGCTGLIEQALSGMTDRERPLVLSFEELGQAARPRLTRPMRPAASHLAYVVYTSGSSGAPKGVMIHQGGLMNNLNAKILDLELSAADVIAQTAALSFNVSVWQFLTVLMVGGRVHIVADETVRDPALLVEEAAREGLTVLEVVPSMLRAMLDYTRAQPTFSELHRLRSLILTGEALPADLCRDWLRHFPGIPLINAYGGAECSDDATLHRMTEPPPAWFATAPVGRPIANTRLYVMDAQLQPVPIGIVGELCVGGAGVGRGYLNDPEQTRRRFLRDPFSRRPGARLYRTGDLGRWCADGYLEFFGRVDHQVKVRGYRIELPEIEHVLMQHPEVGAAVVLARNDLGAETRLVAYIVAAERSKSASNALREFLQNRLPDYMVPTGFIMLERMPLNANGKIDRQAVATMGQGVEVACGDFAAPRDSTEEVLAAIWADLLAVERVGVFDNFFALGGHSLLAGRVLARVAAAFGTSLPLAALFEAPTVAMLAARVKHARAESKGPALELMRVEADGPRPVSIAQEHLLSLDREIPGLPQFNLPFAYRLEGHLDVVALEGSLAEVVRRHESLRTAFAWIDRKPAAILAPEAEIDISFVIEDVAPRKLNGNKRARALLLRKARLRAEEHGWIPFDVTRAPLFRARLLRLGSDDHILLLILHHAIVDGWSIGLLFEEISTLYSAFALGRPAQLPRPALQFSDFARWQRQWSESCAASEEFAYWKTQLCQVTPVFPTKRGAVLLDPRVGHQPIHIPSHLVDRLGVLSRGQGGTLFMTLLTVFKALLMARSGRDDICVATAMANRPQPEIERTVGPLENTTVIRTRLHRDLSLQEALGRVRKSVLDAHAKQHLPFDIVAARLAEEDDLDPAELIQVFFALQNPLGAQLRLPNVAVRSFGNVHREGQPVLPIDSTLLTVMFKHTAAGITGSWSHKENVFKPKAIRGWVKDYLMMLANASADPQVPLGRLLDR